MNSSNENKQPKKRGRKPNKKIIYKENPVFAADDLNISDLIIKLNNDKKEDNNNLNLVLDDDNSQLSHVTHNYKNKVCWNCCHNFHNIVLGLPISYNNDIFHTIGDFCSVECMSRYALDNHNDDIYEIFPLINLYNNTMNNSVNKIRIAPNRLMLNIFGGDMDIDNYRNNNTEIYDIKLPIIIPVNYNVNKYSSKNNNNLSNGLKLYRKKKLDNNNNISDKIKIIS